MCGIAGKVDFNKEPAAAPLALMNRMAGSLKHRGPDEFGYYRDHHAALVHARLSIIDLASGQQPLSNEDSSLWIVFNGEIFNYLELRKELLAGGHVFKTKSDTEVILHAYESWGEECFSRFNGQWALAIWDMRRKRLLLCRDRVGVRPLFVKESAGKIWFGSEVKSIFADAEVERKINPAGLDQTFTYWGTIAPLSIFSGIEELRPGSIRTYGLEGRKTEKIYWQPRYPSLGPEKLSSPNRLPIEEAALELESRLMNASKLRTLRSDVPVGSYLSGGLDSSLVAWMGRRAKEGEFRTFSIRFADEEFDETKYQRLMVSTLESRHEEIVVTRGEIAEIFPDVIYHTERPVLRTAPAPLFLLSKLVHDSGFKAVLTGEGADEMFAGYDIFREAKLRRFLASEPGSAARTKLFDRLYPYLARSPLQTKGMAIEFWKRGLDEIDSPGFSHQPRWTTTAALKKFFSGRVKDELSRSGPAGVLESLPEEFLSWDPLSRAQYLEIVTLFSPYIISSQGDRMLMAHSVEGRFPFLDSEVMQYANSLPAEYKLIGLDEKKIIKMIAKGKVPEEIINRKKQPYRAPDAVSFLAENRPDYVSEMFSEQALKEYGLFDPPTAIRLFRKCAEVAKKEGAILGNNDNMGFVGILSGQLLFHLFIRTREVQIPEVAFRVKVDNLAEIY